MGDSSRDLVGLSLPYGLENVVGEGWASCGGVLFSTGAGPNLLRFPRGAKRKGFVSYLMSRKTENLRRPRTVIGPRNLASSWSPHNAQQRMSGKQNREEKMK